MRIVHVITDLYVGGAEMMLCKLLAAMDRIGHETTVVSLMGDGALAGRISALGVEVIELGLPRRGISARAAARAIATLRRLAPDVLQGWMYHGNVAASAWSAVAGSRPRLYWNIRQSLQDIRHEKHLTRWLIRRSCRWSSHTTTVVFNSAASAAQHEALGFDATRTLVIPNGFDTDLFAPSADAAGAFRRGLDIPADVPLVGLAARRHACKGHADFLAAAAQVRDAVPDARFVCVGRGVTREDDELRRIIASKDLEASVHLLGHRDDMTSIMSALDVYCQASLRNEGFPNVVGEALSCGALCVATDVGDTRRLVDGLGVLVPPGDVGAMAEGIVSCLGMDPERRRDLSRAGRRRILDGYSIRSVADRYGDLYTGRATGSV